MNLSPKIIEIDERNLKQVYNRDEDEKFLFRQ